ncbi:MAG: hypothetical protein ACE5JR_06450 [Gemmatimonadota bacterium]
MKKPAPPAISVYLPTHRAGGGVDGDSLRFRASLDRARALLSGDVAAAGRRVLDSLASLIGDGEFWRHQADGLAVFAAPDFQRLYRLPVSFPELVVVATSFVTRPLIEYLQAPDRFWVLALSQKAVRLWEGASTGLTAVNLTGVPRSLQEALGRQVTRDPISFHSPRGGGAAPVYHGHGVGVDDAKDELARFFRKVDAGVRDLLAGETGPFILAAVDYYHPIYRSVSRLRNLAEDGIVGNVIEWDVDQLHEAAWPIVRATVEREIDEAVKLWEASYGRGKAESDIAAAGFHAVSGRVRLLLTEKDRRVWGKLDRSTGVVEVLKENGPDPGQHAVDLLDELAEVAIQHGGRTLVIPQDRMPTRTGLAAVLR